MSGISAAADDASVAGSNPAGMTRFDSRVMRGEILTPCVSSTIIRVMN